MAAGASARRTPKISATDLVRYEWLGRVVAEYRSAAVTQELVLWLIQMGASPDLIRLGLRIVDDELVHAELSRNVWLAAGGSGMVPLDRNQLGIGRAHPVLEHDVISVVVRIFCLGETVAVPLFSNLRRGAKVPIARKALDRILKDEVRHRAFGWIALQWLLERPDHNELRQVVDRGLPGFIAGLEVNYGDHLEGGIAEVSEAERAWGVAPAEEYSAILHRAFERDFRRRFTKLGIVFPISATPRDHFPNTE